MGDQLRDLSQQRRRFRVSVAASPLFDAMLATWSALGADDKAASHEIGMNWFDEFRTRIPAEANVTMERLGLSDGSMWAVVLSYVAAHGPTTSSEILSWLESDRGELASGILGELGWRAGEDVLAAAQAGDEEARAAVLAECKPHGREACDRFFAAGEDLGPQLAGLIRTIHDEVYAAMAGDWETAIEASAAATRQLAEVMPPRELIEYITSGLDYEIPLGMTRMVAVPSVTLRPWTLVTQFDDALVVSYSVDDDHIAADPQAPPGWLVRYHKALGDERRLRILRHVARQPATLAELTELIGLAKSTVFHHIGVLRAAGLVRVSVDPENEGATSYEVRWKTLGDARMQIDKYLETTITQETS